ncbi:MAG: hypothetical protein KatS3mg105_4391 [Gemmatales bacterium]|nr:MAG: hypothetical protein KatS3mg105_4391 [Gemmatales bacterium]
MHTMDYVVLIGYFVAMIAIGVYCSLKIKKQEDFFMGGRGFGRLLQTFAAFGAGTGAQDPINVGRTTWTSGLSGVWSALMWLFVTPFYWIFAVWYRRMRHITLGDWFVERYESQPMGVAYTAFAFYFYMFYLSAMFTGVAKVAAPVLGAETVQSLVGMIGSQNPDDLKYILVPIIALVVVAYGVVGGLTAAYWTDLIQGMCIIFLSIILIPYGLNALVEKYGSDYAAATGQAGPLTTMDGFRIMHQRVSPDNFQLFGGPKSGEFPLHFIVSLSVLALVGIVVQPHFIATGGGTAKTENSARVGLVTGNFLKRFCTIGWALTALIVLALLAESIEINEDPDRAWGVASRDILGNVTLGGMPLGLVGLMLACLLAAMMSSADCYMLVTSALLVRNIYAPYINPNASEKTYVMAGRVAGLLIIAGAAFVAITYDDVFRQYFLALQTPLIFAAPFWVGMYWRRATTAAAWLTIGFSTAVFFLLPYLVPVVWPSLRTHPDFAITNNVITTITEKQASPADVAKRDAQITLWNKNVEAVAGELIKLEAEATNANVDRLSPSSSATILAADTIKDRFGVDVPQSQLKKGLTIEAVARLIVAKKLGEKPQPLSIGDTFKQSTTVGGKAVFWADGLKPIGSGTLKDRLVEIKRIRSDDGKTVTIVQRYQGELEGQGAFIIDYLLYQWLGVDLRDIDSPMLTQTMRLPPRLITPFLVMILLSLVTRPGSQEALDRYYVKMKTPVDPDPEKDRQELEVSYADPSRFDDKKLFPGTSLEMQKPNASDIIGFVVSVGVCFLFLALAYWVANIGS